MTRVNSDNLFGFSPYIVDATASEGSYVTVQTAIDAAFAAGGGYVAIKEGTYTENLTIRSGVFLHGIASDGRLPVGVLIDGNHNFSPVAAGVNISGIENIGFRATIGDNFTLAPAAGAFCIIACKYCNLQSNVAGSINVVYNPAVGAFANFVTVNSTFDSQGPNFDLTIGNSQLTFESSSASSNSFEAIRLGAAASANLRYSETAGATYCITAAGGTFTSQFSSFQSGLENIFMTGATSSYQASQNKYSCTAGSGFYITGPAGCTYFYGGETIDGSATAIDPNVTEFKNICRPTADVGVAPGTLVARGTAAFDSAQFTSTDGFIQIVAGAAGLIWSDQPASTTVTANSGSFAIAGMAMTLTLPTGAADGTVCEFKLDAIGPLTVMADVVDKIRIGAAISVVGGTATTTAQGDALTLTYRAIASTWIANSVIGVWTVV